MGSKTITAAGLAAVISVFTSASFAQVEVVESSPTIRSIGQPSARAQNPFQPAQAQTDDAFNMQAELFTQMQMLQQEVQTLRGMVEEMGYEVQRLKQQRMDDYIDLDRRLSELGGAGANAGSAGQSYSGSAPSQANVATTTPRMPVTTQTPVSTPSVPSSADEMTAYRDAMDFLLQKKDYDSAIKALNDYLQRWPAGSYAPNSHYWLGEIYLLKNDLPEAERWFTQLIQQFPQDRKANDAKFKLGRVYFQMGNKAKAKTMFEEVAASDGDAAPLARNFLQENYP